MKTSQETLEVNKISDDLLDDLISDFIGITNDKIAYKLDSGDITLDSAKEILSQLNKSVLDNSDFIISEISNMINYMIEYSTRPSLR